MNHGINKWKKSPLVWQEGETEYISVVFTWDLPKVKAYIRQEKMGIKRRIVGGPAVKILPDYFSGDPVEIGDCYPGVLQIFNPLATRTSQGCFNNCPYCAVKKIHPKFKTINNYPLLPVICDDNLLQSSYKHFMAVIDKLQNLSWCDFNQGLEARQITKAHIEGFRSLNKPIIRLAWDNILSEGFITLAIERLLKAGIPARNIRCYVLIGFHDTPDDALYRLETLYKKYKVKPNPMRYQPLSGPEALEKNSYVDPAWTKEELDRFMSYWANLRFTAGVPFAEYEHHKKSKNSNQMIFHKGFDGSPAGGKARISS